MDVLLRKHPLDCPIHLFLQGSVISLHAASCYIAMEQIVHRHKAFLPPGKPQNDVFWSLMLDRSHEMNYELSPNRKVLMVAMTDERKAAVRIPHRRSFQVVKRVSVLQNRRRECMAYLEGKARLESRWEEAMTLFGPG